MLATNFRSLTTAHDVTQYLRGRLFIYVDFLMAHEYKKPEEAIPRVISFLHLVVKLIVKWLELFPSLLSSVREKDHG